MNNDMQAILNKQKQAFLKEGRASAEARVDRLKRLYRMIGENQATIKKVLDEDFGCHSFHQTQMSEIMAQMAGIEDTIRQVPKWMKPERRRPLFPLGWLGASARVEYVPKGVVGNLATWNFPIYTSFLPVAGIFAAGNRAMVKMSELNPKTSATMQQLVASYFDETELVVISGGPEVGAEFAALPFDHIIFTGGTGIGRHILRAAAENLTPCTLELGGKSPVIVGRSYNTQKAAQRVMTGKALNQGQACLAPDYCLVPAEEMETFIQSAIAWYSELFPTVFNNPDYTSVVNQRHYQRLMNYIQDAKNKGADIRQINPANEDPDQQKTGVHKIPMTLIVNPGEDMLVMQEELFGPVLCIKSYDNIDDCIHYINNRPRPLGLYYFGEDAEETRKVLDHTTSGGVTLNDVMAHSSCDDLPFGGIGPSGMGNYHGIDGFRTFSHARAIFKQTSLDIMRYSGMLPPYGEKAQKQLDRLTKIKF
jgi:coniferyl-aldehyde dehydrogenase